jgi:lon-related putative ATP-dependent protease
MTPTSTQELSPNALRRACDPASLSFDTTDDLPDLQDVIGQPRALRALELGSEVPGPGFNIFVLGTPGSGRTTLSQEYLKRKAAAEPVPDDWVYVYNFENVYSPRAIRLPAGRGVEFHKDMIELVKHSEKEIPRAFESEEYVREREQLVGELKKTQEAEFLKLQEYVEKYNFVIVRTSSGFVLAPAVQGKPLKPEDIERLSPEQRSKLEQLQVKLGEEAEITLNRLREIERLATEQLSELNVRTARFLVSPWVKGIKEKYSKFDKVLAHLDSVESDVINNIGQFQSSQGSGQAALPGQSGGTDWLRRYDVNLLIDNSAQKGAPVVVESHPSYTNLVGRIEHEFVLGMSRTDFTMIRPGAFHHANGGYLILPARDVLINPYAWEGLKRILRDRSIRIVELASQLGMVSTVTLEPEPIPLETKVVLVGTPMLYYLLSANDEDFAKLFKVRAEFATLMERNPQTEQEYGLFVKSVADDNHLLPFDRTAVARLIEYSSRLVEDQDKLSTRFGKIADLICEAAYWTKKEKLEVVTSASMQQAIDESIYRNNLLDERLQELIAKDILMINVSGKVIGQINALSVIELGDHAFGRPSRLTASVSPGRGGVIDIERQAKLGGPVHTKGVLIISGYLAGRYGRTQPLNLSASLTFEQSYEGIEGDSASAAELFALLSAIAEIPLRQDRAITGSVNQHGQIQAIGGVNEKIEGFFTTCETRGLSGEQGVLIPAANQKNLMLSAEVIAAVSEGKFHIWPITTVEEGLALLSDREIGELQVDGGYPVGTFNHSVASRLAEFAKAVAPPGDGAHKES